MSGDELSATAIMMMQSRKQLIIDCCSGMSSGWIAAIKSQWEAFDYQDITEAEENRDK